MFVDTHCHLNIMVDKKRDEILEEKKIIEIEKIIIESENFGVFKIINIATSLNESINSVSIARRFSNVFAVVGIHPCDCTSTWKKDFEEIKKMLLNKEQNKIIGIGETGLDFYHKPFDKQRQIDVFKAHIELALKYDLPIVVHARDSIFEVLDVLQEFRTTLKGVNHCFVHDMDVANKFLELNFCLGIGGPITYLKNEELRKIVKNIPLGNLILETDAPFLPPQQFRGKQNHPKYIPLIAEAISNLKNIDLEKISQIINENVNRLFKI